MTGEGYGGSTYARVRRASDLEAAGGDRDDRAEQALEQRVEAVNDVGEKLHSVSAMQGRQ